MTPGDVTARVLVDLPTSARRTARGFPVVPIHTTLTSVIDAHTPHYHAVPSRPRVSLALVLALRPRDRRQARRDDEIPTHSSVPTRVSPASRIPRARVPSTRRIRAGAFRRLARAESRPSLARAKIPARHRHPRSNAMDAHDSRARRRTGSNANARRTSSDARKVRARAHPRDRRRRRHARRRARVCRRRGGSEWARDGVAMKTSVSLFTHTNVCG